MPRYNKNFKLSIEDIDIIENALKNKMELLSKQKLVENDSSVKEVENKIKDIHDLLGRTHNQKIWYRPKGIYVSG